MFKGIISQIGIIDSILLTSDVTKRIFIQSENIAFFNNITIGSSIACSGICLTVADIFSSQNGVKYKIAVDLSKETLSVSNANYWKISSKLNLENPMMIGDTLDGHFVQGHVDTIVTILSITTVGNCYKMEFSLPEDSEYLKYIIKKGSLALDGVSLTVNSILKNNFSVNIIPHTWNNTTFHCNQVNDKLNLEIDMIARYLESIINR